MSKGRTFQTEMLSHVLNNANIALVGDATGLLASTTPGSLYVSLHTADVGETGTQETSEATYTDYARVAIARSGATWTVTTASPASATNAGAITFPAATGGSSTCSHFAVGTASSGAGKVLYKGAIGTPLAVTTGIEPRFPAGDLTLTED